MAAERKRKSRVLSKNLAYPGDGLYYYKSKPFTGIKVYKQDGRLEAEVEYRSGMLWGVKRSGSEPGHWNWRLSVPGL